MRIDPAAATPLYQQIATDIRRKIVDGVLAVGDRLPPHRSLSKQYGVSLITINKALSGLVSEGVLNSRVGRGTSVAVRPAAMATHDQAHVSAALPAGSTIGFVLRDLNSPFFSLVAHAAEQRAHTDDLAMLLLSSGNTSEREETQIRRLLEVGVDGLVVVSMSRTTYRLSDTLTALQARQFPFVMVSYTEGDNVPFVGTDFDRAGELVAEHFRRLGRTRWGYLTDRFGSLAGAARSAGYRRMAQEYGFPVSDAFVFEYPYEGEWNDIQSGYEIGTHIAGLPDRPDAIFAFNDLGAIGAIDGLMDHGLRVPEDVAVVGLDDVAPAARSRVPLTTVRQASDAIGTLAVDALLRQMRTGEPVTRQLVAPTLIVRRSCGAAASQRTPDVLPAPPRERVRAPRSLAEFGQYERARLVHAHGVAPPP